MLAVVAGAVTYIRVKTSNNVATDYNVDKVEKIDYEKSSEGNVVSMRTKTARGTDKYNVEDVLDVEYVDVTIDTTGTGAQKVTVSGKIGDYTYVDLGLASGVKWATYNVGASKPIENGNYYSWGEIEAKDNYTWETYKWCENIWSKLTKYCSSKSYGVNDRINVLEFDDDAAAVNWGGVWRMPNTNQQTELINGCQWSYVANYLGTGVAGYLGTSKTNKATIFFPASGFFDGEKQETTGATYCWGLQNYTSNTINSYVITFSKGGVKQTDVNRCFGATVRAVADIEADPKDVTVSGERNGFSYVDLGLPSGLKWAVYNLGATQAFEYGDTYAWGETETKGNYAWSTYKLCKETSGSIFKYLPAKSSTNDADNKTILEVEDDAAYVNWGDEWRMPTTNDFNELRDGCDWKLVRNFNSTKVDGLVGVSKTNGNVIFLPAAGYSSDTYQNNFKSEGFYWTSSVSSNYNTDAYYMGFDTRVTSIKWQYFAKRMLGYYIRAVSDDKFTVNFYNQDSTLIKSQVVFLNKSAETPKLKDFDGYYFDGWSDSSFMKVQKDVDVYAVFKEASSFSPAIVDGVSLSGKVDGYPFVDLGLPSGIKWATFNVGAHSCQNAGIYVAWGETAPKSTKYNAATYSLKLGSSTLKAESDVATVNWTDDWCMPTSEELDELIQGCTWVRVSKFNGSGVDGLLGTSKANENTIFIPYSGYRLDEFTYSGAMARLWTSSPVLDDTTKAYAGIVKEKDFNVNAEARSLGACVRAIVARKHTVNFYDQDKKLLVSYSAVSGRPVVAPEMPEKEGFYFSWSDSSFSAVNADLDVYAVYTPKPVYSVNFYGLNKKLLDSQQPLEGDTVKQVQIPDEDGFFIVGWSDSIFGQPVKKDMDIFALYKKLYTVNFYTYDSTFIETKMVIEHTSVEPAVAPTRKGYRFIGWGDVLLSDVDGNLDLYAQYEPAEKVSGSIDGYDYVDLGLPSGVKWATCNVGATEPTGRGSYFAWGESKSRGDKNYSWNSYKYRESILTDVTKYGDDGLITLEAIDDAATVNWGEKWRMPTYSEQSELINGCDWEWTDDYNETGVAGMIGVSKANGNIIFLPKFGYCNLFENTDYGVYWSSSLDKGSYQFSDAHYLELKSGGINTKYSETRCTAAQIRAVSGSVYTVNFYSSDKKLLKSQLVGKGESAIAPNAPIRKAYRFVGWSDSSFTNVQSKLDVYAEYELDASGTIAGYHYVDLGLKSGLKWACYNVGTTELTEVGHHFAWGETKAKDDYSWSNYSFGSMQSISKYSDLVDGKSVLEPEDDAASVNWGATWRTPTKEEMKELIDGCDWEYLEDFDGHAKGMLGTSKANGNVIYLQYAEAKDGTYITYAGGHYWSSNENGNYPDFAYCMVFGDWLHGNDDYSLTFDQFGREKGCNIRAVSK